MNLSIPQRLFCEYANTHRGTKKILSFVWPGRRHGCTTATCVFALEYAHAHPGCRILMVVDTERICDLNYIRCTTTADELKMDVQSDTRIRNAVTLTNQSCIYFRTLSDRVHMRGEMEPDLILCDCYHVNHMLPLLLQGIGKDIPAIVQVPMAQIPTYPLKMGAIYLTPLISIRTRIFILLKRCLISPDLTRYLIETMLGSGLG